MALVERNCRLYAYKSIRRGGRVTSEYRGSGMLALGVATLDAEGQEERAERAERQRAERRRLDELDRAAGALAAGALDLARRTLEEAGYHRHDRGPWRKRRGHRESTGEGQS
jgi:hypothetical protein